MDIWTVKIDGYGIKTAEIGGLIPPVKNKEELLKGYLSRAIGLLMDAKPNFGYQESCNQWRENLTELIEEIKDGI